MVAKSAQLAGVFSPAGVEHVVTLRDGGIVRVRPIHPDDESRLPSFFERLSPRTVYQRFFTTYRRLPAAWYRESTTVAASRWQSRGLGTGLFRLLIETARARGHERFCADVLAENDRMLKMLRTQTEIQQTSAERGVIHVCFGPRTSLAVA